MPTVALLLLLKKPVECFFYLKRSFVALTPSISFSLYKVFIRPHLECIADILPLSLQGFLGARKRLKTYNDPCERAASPMRPCHLCSAAALFLNPKKNKL